MSDRGEGRVADPSRGQHGLPKRVGREGSKYTKTSLLPPLGRLTRREQQLLAGYIRKCATFGMFVGFLIGTMHCIGAVGTTGYSIGLHGEKAKLLHTPGH